MNHRTISFVLLASVVLVPNARGEELLDFADPCVKAGKQLKSTSAALRTNSDAVLKKWDNLKEPPPELMPYYKEAIKLAIYNAWLSNPLASSLIEETKKANPQFDSLAFFTEKVYPTAVKPEQEADFINGAFVADYATTLRPKILAERQALENKIKTEKDTLDGSCKNGEFDKLFRATIGNFAGIVASNFAASTNEKGDMAKAVRALSGVSLTDIQKHGILGGPGSELNKALNNALGNSDLKKLIVGLANLNPASWKIDLPKVDLPKLPNAPQLPNIPLPQFPTAPKIDLPKLPSCCKF